MVLGLAVLLALIGGQGSPGATAPTKEMKLGSRSQALSPDGRCLACAVSDGTLRVYDLPEGRQRWRRACAATLNHEETWSPFGHGLEWSPDGKHLAAKSAEGRLAVLDSADGSPSIGFTAELPAPEQGFLVPFVEYVDDGKSLVVCGGDRAVRKLDAITGKIQWEHRLGSMATACCVSRDLAHFAIGDENGVLTIFGTASSEPEFGPIWLPRPINDLDFDAGARRIAVAAGDCKARVIDLRGKPGIRELSHCDLMWYDGDGLGWARFSPDGSTLLSSTQGDWEVRCWNLEWQALLWEYEYGGGNPGPMPAVFSRDSKNALLSVGGRVCDGLSGRLLGTLCSPGGSLRFAPGMDVAWVVDDGSIRVLRVPGGEPMCTVALGER